MALSLQVAYSRRDKWLNPSMPPHWARWGSWPTRGQDAIKLCNLIIRNSILTTQNPYNYDLNICEICIEENNEERKEGGKGNIVEWEKRKALL